MATDKFTLLRKILKALGLSDERIDELISWIRTWLLNDSEKKTGEIKYPYHLRDDFLSPAEQNFMQVLRRVTKDWALISPKVSLGDLFYAKTGDYSQNRIYRNKIDRKHVDFLLCDPMTLRPIIGIELDDKSHRRKDRQQRDVFVDGVFAAAGLPIAHVPVKHSYQVAQLDHFLQQKAQIAKSNVDSETHPASEAVEEAAEPKCPKCGSTMVLRTAARGQHKGNQFWGCSDYPRCKGTHYYSSAL